MRALVVVLAVAVVAAVTAACGDDEAAKKAAAPVGAVFDAAPPPVDARPPVVVEALPAGVTEEAALDDARALPAWSAVLERGRLLGRRGERGAVFGRVGPTVGGTGGAVWLLDESETARGLGIRVTTTSGGEFPAKAGERILAYGAWTTTADRKWVFAAARLVRLAAGEGGAPAGEAFLPGELVRAGEAREGDRTFVVVSAPAKPGDKTYAAPVAGIKTVRKPPLPLLRATAAPVALQ